MSLTAPVFAEQFYECDRLTAEEFIRRWESAPDLKQAELIEGVVYLASPLGSTHALFDGLMGFWLGAYAAFTPGCQVLPNATWLMGPDDVPQPDIALRIVEAWGGQSRIDGNYAAGAPELIVEIAESTRSRDLGVKKRLYARMGVREYVVVLGRSRQIAWQVLTADGYSILEPSADGIYRSPGLPGLWLDVEALWAEDGARILRALQQGLASPEHFEFAARIEPSA